MLLLAATRDGLYGCEPRTGSWRRIRLGEGVEDVRRILQIGRRLVVFTDSHAYESLLHGDVGQLAFRLVRLTREGPADDVSLLRFFFELHSGAVWGLPGRLVFDLAAVALIFLSISACYLWFWPRSRKWRRRPKIERRSKRLGKRWFTWLYANHLRVGVWATLILLVMGGTGMFLRPPLLVLLVPFSIPASSYPAPAPENPWHHGIHNCVYDSARDEILIETTGGFWSGPADFSEPFKPDRFRPPIFAMGTTVLEATEDGRFIVGSFGGLYLAGRYGGPTIDLRTGEPMTRRRPQRPGVWMVGGYFKTPGGDAFMVDFREGLQPVGDARRDGRFPMPAETARDYRMPMWSFLFELHNARLFRDWLGAFYIFVPTLGGLGLVLITLTGLLDWAFRSRKVRRRRNPVP